MKKIVILGASIHTGNLGVSALSHSLMNIFSSINDEVEFSLIVPHRKNEVTHLSFNNKKYHVKTINYRLSPFSNLKENYFFIIFMSIIRYIIPIRFIRNLIDHKIPFFKAVKESNIIGDIWGGDSFSDIYGFKVYLKEIIIRYIIISIRKDFIIFPQTFGPYKSKLSQILANKVFKNSSTILSRGREDILKIKQNKKNANVNISFCPDVAFMLEKRPFLHIDTNDSIFLNYEIVGINISGLMYNNSNKYGIKLNYVDIINKLMHFFVIEQGMKVLLIPHTYSYPNPLSYDDDFLSCKRIYEDQPNDIKKNTNYIFYDLQPEEIKDIIGRCSFFIGSRMHSTIAAISQCIPTIGIGYSKKFHEVFSTANISNCVIDGRNISTEEGYLKAIKLFNNRDLIHSTLMKSIPNIKKTIENQFKKIN